MKGLNISLGVFVGAFVLFGVLYGIQVSQGERPYGNHVEKSSIIEEYRLEDSVIKLKNGDEIKVRDRMNYSISLGDEVTYDKYDNGATNNEIIKKKEE